MIFVFSTVTGIQCYLLCMCINLDMDDHHKLALKQYPSILDDTFWKEWSCEIGTDWYEIALKLELPELTSRKLDMIKADNRSVEKCCFDVIQIYRCSNKNLQYLYDCLQGRGILRRTLVNKACSALDR